ncbi:hypothetical protein DE146DRAFT_666979 [Phaeosphaeria sp. MPI-PUGE-AT-0046c]|nr:hypothetical protein DE146DRAFT_666979 [Phaeosphaeria sp. MPI-PUGE-AT-0046c]
MALTNIQINTTIIATISGIILLLLCICIVLFQNDLLFTFSRRSLPSPVDLEAKKVQQDTQGGAVQETSAALTSTRLSSAVSSSAASSASVAPSNSISSATICTDTPLKASKPTYLTVPMKYKRGRLAVVPEQKEKEQVEVLVDPMSFSCGSGETMAAMYEK